MTMSITVMGIIEVATVIHITMTIIDTKITISITRRLRHLPEGEAGSLNRWVVFFNRFQVKFFRSLFYSFNFDTKKNQMKPKFFDLLFDISSSLTVAQCSWTLFPSRRRLRIISSLTINHHFLSLFCPPPLNPKRSNLFLILFVFIFSFFFSFFVQNSILLYKERKR